MSLKNNKYMNKIKILIFMEIVKKYKIENRFFLKKHCPKYCL